jgi:hypothetical protein
MRINYIIKMNILKILGYTSKKEYEREVLSEFLDCLFADNEESNKFTLSSG